MRIFELVSVAAMVGVLAGAVLLLRTSAAVAADTRKQLRRPLTWLVGVPLLVLILAVGIPYVDVHVLNGPPPKPLSFADLTPPSTPTTAAAGPTSATAASSTSTGASTTTPTSVAAGRVTGPTATESKVSAASAVPADPLAGTWSAGTGTEARYGIDDNALGQTSHVVGRTHDVTGITQIVGYTVTSAKVVVNMQSVTCQCVHDGKYRQLLETAKYPTSMFVLTRPVSLASIPEPGTVATVPVTGNFTIHGVTRSATFDLKATRIGSRIAVLATIPVRLSDYNIYPPNGGSFGGLSNCTIEFLIAFDRTG